MAQLDSQKIKKLERGEIIGTVASCFCGAVFIYFCVLFALSWARGDEFLSTLMWATAPALMVIGIVVAAFCNLKYTKDIERLTNKYVVQVFVENAALMHPEKDSLTFYLNTSDKSIEITVNAYKEKIVFDFSAFKKFSAMRKMTALKIVADRLAATFCRMYERGATYKSVEYRNTGKGKTVKIISDGMPDKNIMKNYLKNR